MPTTYFNHQAAFTAVRVCIEESNDAGTKITTGTGFFYLAQVELSKNDLRSKLLLISNRHVLGEGKGKMTLVLNRKLNDGTPDYGVSKTLSMMAFRTCTSHIQTRM